MKNIPNLTKLMFGILVFAGIFALTYSNCKNGCGSGCGKRSPYYQKSVKNNLQNQQNCKNNFTLCK